METKQITTEQIEKVKEWAKDFIREGDFINYYGGMLPSDYCHFLGLDYETIRLLGEVSYTMAYYETEDKKYKLACETYIDSTVNDKLSFILEDSEDYLGFFTKEEEQKIGVAQWLPSNWKELMSDEQKEEIAREWCEENSDELKDFLSDSDRADIAYDYIDDNANDVIDKAYDKLGDYERREFIKECIDNL